jgi:hypothetical protein
VVADPVAGQQWRGDAVEDGLDVAVQGSDLGIEGGPAPGDGMQCRLGGPGGGERVSGPVAAGDAHLASGGERAELAADDLGGGVTDAVELVGGSGAGLECACSSDAELAQRLDGTVAGLGGGGGVTGKHCSCSRLGIDRVGLAAASPVVTVRLVDLYHVQPRARRCRDSPAPHEPVPSTPIAPTSPKPLTQPVNLR